MERRKVVKIGNAFYVNIPFEFFEALKLREGDRLYVFHIHRKGIFVTKAKGKKFKLSLKRIDRIRRIADSIYST